MNEKTDVQIQTGKGRRGMAVIAIVVLAAVLCFVLTACGASKKVFCVGRDAAPEAITAFYSTEAASTNPPYRSYLSRHVAYAMPTSSCPSDIWL